MSDKVKRCAVCGWPLAGDRGAGCRPGDCSMRPLPGKLFDRKRAILEYGELAPAKWHGEPPPTVEQKLAEAQAEIAKLREGTPIGERLCPWCGDEIQVLKPAGGCLVGEVNGHVWHAACADAIEAAIASPPPAQEGPTLREPSGAVTYRAVQSEGGHWWLWVGTGEVGERSLQTVAPCEVVPFDAALKAAGRE